MRTNQNNTPKKKNWKKIVIIVMLILAFFPFKRPERMAKCHDLIKPAEWTTPLLYFVDDYIKSISCKKKEKKEGLCIKKCKETHPDNFNCTTRCVPIEKPVIYLYPKHKTDVRVKLNFKGKIIASYPNYNQELSGWDVTAYPDGKIINHFDNQEYSYLFWEGQSKEMVDWDFSKGFVVKGEDTKEFLQKTLPKLGLTPKEYNDFIVYWFPLMQHNKYNLIHFANKQYTDIAPLTIDPKPDSILRVFMVYKPLEKPIEIEKQEIKPFKRQGFTVVEWGGTKAD